MAGVCDPPVGVIQPAGGGGAPLPLGGDLSGTTDAARVIKLGNADVVTTWAEFIALPGTTETPPASGIWTYTSTVITDTTITVPAGERMVSGETGVLFSHSLGPVESAYVGDVDGPMLSGPVVVRGVSIVNTNTGPLAFGVDISTSLGRFPFLETQSVNCIRGVKTSGIFGVVSMFDIGITQPDNELGILFTGFIGLGNLSNVSQSVGTGAVVGIAVDAGAVIAGAIAFDATKFGFSAPGQSGFAFSDAMTVFPGGHIFLAGCLNAGPQNALIQQGPGLMSPDDPRLILKGNPSIPNTVAGAVVTRVSTIDPVGVVMAGAPTVPVVIPYDDGVTALEIDLSAPLSQFSFFKDPTDNTRWWTQYRGVIPNAPGTAEWTALIDRSAGSGDLTGCVERNDAEFALSVQLDDGGVFTDFTAAAADPVPGDVQLLPPTLTTDDAISFGLSVPWGTVTVLIAQSGVGTYTVIYEYWDGATFQPAVGVVDRTSGFTAAPGEYDIDHTPQPGWVATTVNGVLAYHIQARANPVTSMTTQPLATSVRIYAGWTIIDNTVGLMEYTNAKLRNNGRGSIRVDPDDRFRPALNNETTAATARVWQINMSVLVLP